MGVMARQGPNLSGSNYDRLSQLEGGKKLSSDNIPTVFRNHKPLISRNLVASFHWPRNCTALGDGPIATHGRGRHAGASGNA